MITSNREEVVAEAWKVFHKEHPDLTKKVLAQLREIGEESSIDRILMLGWKMGFYNAMLAYEIGAIKDLSGSINPEHN
jgi:hypothetical protein